MAILNYAGKLILAPMVRSGELPTRLLSLRYGADLVWSPEIVDHKIVTCVREPNARLKSVDFVARYPNKPDQVVLRAHSLERSRLVFQLGTSNPELAVKAATVVAADVAGIDLNAGCPKHFSVHSGSGAGLLKTPDKLVAILEALVAEVGRKFGIGISVKIRILDTPEDTFTLVRRLVKTGISALTVHCRRVPMRPRERAIREGYLAQIAEICHEAGVTCVANGDVYCGGDLERLKKEYGVDSAMIATAAEKNMSCFAASEKEKVRPWREIACEFLAVAKAVENHFSTTKYVLQSVIPGKAPERQTVARARDYEQMFEALQMKMDEGDMKWASIEQLLVNMSQSQSSRKRKEAENSKEIEEEQELRVKRFDGVEQVQFSAVAI